MLATLILALIGAAAVAAAVASVVFFLRARSREDEAPDAFSADGLSEMRALGQRIETLVGQQQLQGETARQQLAQKLDAVGQNVEQQRHHVAGLQNELRHEVRRRDSEIDEIRTQLASIQQAVALGPAPTLSLPPASPDPDDRWDAVPAEPAAPFEPADFPFEPAGDGRAAAFGEPPVADGWDTGLPSADDADAPVFSDPFAFGDPFAAPASLQAEAPAPFADADPFAAPPAAPDPSDVPSVFEISDFEPFDFQPPSEEPPADLPAPTATGAPAPSFFEEVSFGPSPGVTFEALGPVPPAAPTFAAPSLGVPTFAGSPMADAPAPAVPTFDAPVFEPSSFEPSSFEAPASHSPAESASPAPAAETAWVSRADWQAPDAAPRPLFEVPAFEAPTFDAPEAPAFSAPAFEAPAPDPSSTAAHPFEAPSAPTAPFVPPAGADDLTVISSVDEDVQRALYMAGVTTLDEIARWSRSDARRMSAEVSVSEDTILNQWVFEAQAALFHSYSAQQGGR